MGQLTALMNKLKSGTVALSCPYTVHETVRRHLSASVLTLHGPVLLFTSSFLRRQSFSRNKDFNLNMDFTVEEAIVWQLNDLRQCLKPSTPHSGMAHGVCLSPSLKLINLYTIDVPKRFPLS